MNKNPIYALTFLALLQSNVSMATIPTGNGTWTYDSIYNNEGKKIGYSAGLFATKINDFNLLAAPGHKLTQVFSYGGDLEMYCQGSGESDPSETCTEKNMYVFYDQQSTDAYFNALSKTQNPVTIVPIVDGRLDQNGSTDYLKALNNLDRTTAQIYADKVAATYCKDNHVAGVQFDIEPFDIDQPGQAYFYEQIAKNFAGKNNPRPDGTDPLNCVNKQYPQGRFFSIFTFANMVNEKLGTLMNRYQNGFVIDSLYDLGPNPGGTISDPQNYKIYVAQEVQDMMNKSKTYQVKYQFAIAAAASAHEFEYKAGNFTGYKQLDYVKAAMEAIERYSAKQDKNFLGINIWAWNDRMFWQNNEYKPSIPNEEVLHYLAQKL